MAVNVLWVKSGHWVTCEQCPLYPQKQTSIERVGMSALCQKRTLRYLNSVPYLLAISFNCCLLRCIAGTPGRVAISRKKHSSPVGAMVQSRTISCEAFSKPCQLFIGMKMDAPLPIG